MKIMTRIPVCDIWLSAIACHDATKFLAQHASINVALCPEAISQSEGIHLIVNKSQTHLIVNKSQTH